MKNEIRNNELFIDLSSVLEPMGYWIVAVNSAQIRGSVNVSLIIKKKEDTEGVDDCAEIYHVVYPRLSVKFEARDLNLEVSTPGIQRVFKDIHEFELFLGKRCRIFDSRANATISGVIASCQDEKVCLTDYVNEDSGEKGENYEISFADVYKAKLDYKWEDVK